MTDRFHSLTVVLDHDIREDDAEGIINAIRHLRGVISVTGNVVDAETWMAEERARHGIGAKLLDILYPKMKSP